MIDDSFSNCLFPYFKEDWNWKLFAIFLAQFVAPQWGNILTLNSGTLQHHNGAAALFTSLRKTQVVMFNQRQQRRERESRGRTDSRERREEQTTTDGGRNHMSPNKSGTRIISLCQSEWWQRLALVCLSRCQHFWEINIGYRSNPTKHDTTTGLDANQRRGWGWRRILCLGLEHEGLVLSSSLPPLIFNTGSLWRKPTWVDPTPAALEPAPHHELS